MKNLIKSPFLELKIAAQEVKKAHTELGKKYRRLCEVIREHQLGPRQVRGCLLSLGFHKVRVAEIITVACCADELWNDFKTEALGFRKALEYARELGPRGEYGKITPGQRHKVQVAKLVKRIQCEAGRERKGYATPQTFEPDGSKGIFVTIQYFPMPWDAPAIEV